MYHTKTIADVIEEIGESKIFLPAIQRKYVWDVGQICNLMDSVMRGYPFGTFLFWKIQKQDVNKNNYALYEFIRSYSEKDGNNNKKVSMPLTVSAEFPEAYITAVLDGQQRLTSFHIALKGDITVKEPHKRYNDPNAYVTKELYFDLLCKNYEKIGAGAIKEASVSGEGEEPSDYEQIGADANEETSVGDESEAPFDFLTETSACAENDDDTHFWYKVKDILQYPDLTALNKLCRKFSNKLDESVVDIACDNITLLFNRIKTEKLINYFEICGGSLDSVLDIFVRVNSAGTVLSKTDLLFSTVVAQWADGRDKIDNCVKSINEIGERYKFTSDFILRTCLYILDKPTALKVSLLDSATIDAIKIQWEDIYSAIYDTVNLLNESGFFCGNIISYNAVIPIIYYRYHTGAKAFDNAGVKQELKKYFVIAQLKQIFGRSTDGVLSTIRSALKSHMSAHGLFSLAWLQSITFPSGTNLVCSPNDIDEWFMLEKGERTFLILTLLYPNIKYSRVQFHQDHMHPYSAFNKKSILSKVTLPDGSPLTENKIKDWKRKRNTLPNLQILEGHDNQSKKDLPLDVWLKALPPADKAAAVKYLPPATVSLSLNNFDEFCEERKKLMEAELMKILI